MTGRAIIALLWEKEPPAGLFAQVKGIGKYMISVPETPALGWFMLYLLPQAPGAEVLWLRANQSVEKLKFFAQEDVTRRMMEP